ncbi:MAG: endonuclease [Muribaculaceae bacterium]|nr:endonuclease [Muribaculaceae bacterium]
MNFTAKFCSISACVALAALSGHAAAPSGYYSSCENKGGKSLLTALHSTIGAHTTVSYKGLLELYKTSDVYPDGKIWDMYSTKHWSTGETCGNYKVVGDCYNREHSFPKSWFDDASPMYSDAFHIYPTDGKVNGQRSNYPYGECSGGTTLASNGSVKALGKLGKSTFPGYSGTVFEPVDEYKGDFARSYFYMAACYNDRIARFSSDMLAGNDYPVFSKWAIDLLLKWHRMDPVSEKEKNRNDVVYKSQRNRNPFIDHPEMVEYIWGDKSAEKWTSGATPAPTVNRPADKSTIDLGISGVNKERTATVAVQTSNATGTVTLSTDNAAFAVSPSSVSASAANAGTEVTVTYKSATTGIHTSKLTVAAGTARSTVTLTGRTVDGIPVDVARDVTDESFVIGWTYVGDEDASGCYRLTVSDSEGVLDGYPRSVNARAQTYTVSGLAAETEYEYSLSGTSLRSESMRVTTGAVVPSIDFLYDGDLVFTTAPGEPSAVAEILISTDNIESDFTVSVKAPFEISLDRSDWKQSLTLSADDTRLYMRLNSATEGTFETTVRAQCGSYVSDDAVARGVATLSPTFFEDFEQYDASYGSYSAKTYYGNACVWDLSDAGMWAGDAVYEGKYALRTGKSEESVVAMAEDRMTGIGTVSFYSRVFGTDADASVDVEYSTDGGVTYSKAGTVTVSGQQYKEYSVAVNCQGKVRMRLRQTKGRRFMVDALSLTDYSSGVDDVTADYHQWDAYSRGGELVVEVRSSEGAEVCIYSIDGTTVFAGQLPSGIRTFGGLVPGRLYIVVSGEHSRNVIVR